MDDVDYLVEGNAMDDFCLSSEMDGTHGRTTFEDDPEQQLLRRVVHSRMVQWRCKLEQNANAGNDS
jgi:DNA-directed RNA polymerase-5 subunit 1